MKEIVFLYNNYNFGSYSIIRSTKEYLSERKDLKVTFLENSTIDAPVGCDVWLFGSNIPIDKNTYKYFKDNKSRVVVFGLSDPNMFDQRRLANCDVYVTNDLSTYIRHVGTKQIYWLTAGCDTKYHVPSAVKKFDSVFLGSIQHKSVPFRKQYLEALQTHTNKSVRVHSSDGGTFISGGQLIQAYSSAHLNIDISTRTSSLPGRLFEAGACGTTSLTVRRPDTEALLGDDVLYYDEDSGPDGFIVAYDEALSDKDRLGQMGRAVGKRCRDFHDIRRRINGLLMYLGYNNDGSTTRG